MYQGLVRQGPFLRVGRKNPMSAPFSDPWQIFPAGCAIAPLDQEARARALAHINDQTKPRGSLGRLEDIAHRLAGMRHPFHVAPAQLFTVAGDHGVCSESVSLYPQEVTRQMVANFLAGGAAINALTWASGMDLVIVDAGCCGGPFADERVINRRLGEGTDNIAHGPAMSLETCCTGLRNGIALALEAVDKGSRCLAIGEMGIANTTAATALYAHLLGLSVAHVVGPGTGIDQDMLAHKADVVRRALVVNARQLAANGEGPDPVRALACLGGFEIVTMAGIILGGAAAGVPVLIDGFISSSAYVAAVLLCPEAASYCFVAHASTEPGHVLGLQKLGHALGDGSLTEPLLHLGMHLGEGTGCAAAYPLLRCAVAAYEKMATFSQGTVSDRMPDKAGAAACRN